MRRVNRGHVIIDVLSDLAIAVIGNDDPRRFGIAIHHNRKPRSSSDVAEPGCGEGQDRLDIGRRAVELNADLGQQLQRGVSGQHWCPRAIKRNYRRLWREPNSIHLALDKETYLRAGRSIAYQTTVEPLNRVSAWKARPHFAMTRREAR